MGEFQAAAFSGDARIAELQAALAAAQGTLAIVVQERDAVVQERDRLRASHERLLLELEILRRRLFVAKAERVDTAQLQLEFAEVLRQIDALAGTPAPDSAKSEDEQDPKTRKTKSRGRRDLKDLPLEEVRIDIPDPLYEDLVAEGKAKRIGSDDSSTLGWQRGGMRRIVVARIKYQVIAQDGADTAIDTAPMPPRLFPRSLCAPSLLAHIIVLKYGQGMPLFRIEDAFRRDGCPVDRGTMCRWIEDAGATCGATIVNAARQDALSAFCIATDATGIAVQPIRTHEKTRQPCRRGHYFVLIADRDHIFFEYTARETSDTVRALFQGYSGYIQADAKSVYDILFRRSTDKPPDDDDDGCERLEVGCFAHCRRKFWEATVAKSQVAREGLARIGRLFELDAIWRDKSPAEIQRLRQLHMRPHADAFFAWAEDEYEKVRNERGLLRSALGYAVRQKQPLLRVFDDGRLSLDNNRSERALRSVAVGRKAWLFVGSDDHAQSAGHLLSLLASCRLHNLDPEAYMRDIFRILPHWPHDRYLELAPKYFAQTRARLDPSQLKAEFGPLTIPPRLTPAPEQQSAPNSAVD